MSASSPPSLRFELGGRVTGDADQNGKASVTACSASEIGKRSMQRWMREGQIVRENCARNSVEKICGKEAGLTYASSVVRNVITKFRRNSGVDRLMC